MTRKYDNVVLLRGRARQAGLELEKVGASLVEFRRPGLSGRILAKVRAGSGEHFSLRRTDLSSPGVLHIYIWNADTDPEVFVLTLAEALEVLGKEPLETASWKSQGGYKWSSSTGMPLSRRSEMRNQHQDNLGRIRDLFSDYRFAIFV